MNNNFKQVIHKPNRLVIYKDYQMQEHFRAKEAAKYLGVGLSTIWLYIKQEKLKAYKLSDRVTIIKKSDLDSLINANVEVAS